MAVTDAAAAPVAIEGHLAFRVVGRRSVPIVRLRSLPCTIGAGERCTLRLRGAGIAHLHCGITSLDHQIIVQRLAVDTWLNGRSFRSAPLKQGDILRIGPVELEVIELPMVRRIPENANPGHRELPEQPSHTPSPPVATSAEVEGASPPADSLSGENTNGVTADEPPTAPTAQPLDTPSPASHHGDTAGGEASGAQPGGSAPPEPTAEQAFQALQALQSQLDKIAQRVESVDQPASPSHEQFEAAIRQLENHLNDLDQRQLADANLRAVWQQELEQRIKELCEQQHVDAERQARWQQSLEQRIQSLCDQHHTDSSQRTAWQQELEERLTRALEQHNTDSSQHAAWQQDLEERFTSALEQHNADANQRAAWQQELEQRLKSLDQQQQAELARWEDWRQELVAGTDQTAARLQLIEDCLQRLDHRQQQADSEHQQIEGDLTRLLENLTGQSSRLDSQLGQLEQQRGAFAVEMQHWLEEQQSFRQAFAAWSEQFTRHQEQLESQRRELDELRGQWANQQQQFREQLEAQTQQLQQRYEQLEEERRELWEQARETCQASEAAMARWEQRLQQTDAALEQVESRLSALIHSQEAWANQFATHEHTVAQRLDELEARQKEYRDLDTAFRAELHAWQEQTSEAGSDVAARLRALADQVSQLSQRQQAGDDDLQALRQRLLESQEQLTAQAAELERRYEAGHDAQAQRLDAVQEQIERQAQQPAAYAELAHRIEQLQSQLDSLHAATDRAVQAEAPGAGVADAAEATANEEATTASEQAAATEPHLAEAASPREEASPGEEAAATLDRAPSENDTDDTADTAPHDEAASGDPYWQTRQRLVALGILAADDETLSDDEAPPAGEPAEERLHLHQEETADEAPASPQDEPTAADAAPCQVAGSDVQSASSHDRSGHDATVHDADDFSISEPVDDRYGEAGIQGSAKTEHDAETPGGMEPSPTDDDSTNQAEPSEAHEESEADAAPPQAVAAQPVAEESAAELLKRLGMYPDSDSDEEESAEQAQAWQAQPEVSHSDRPQQPASTEAEEGDEDVSVEDYMSRLLARIRGQESPPVPVYQPASPQQEKVDPPARALPEGSQESESASEESYAPRHRAPELNKNMSAMRDLANRNAREALDTHSRRQLKNDSVVTLSVAIVAMLASFVLMWLSTQSQGMFTYWLSLIALVIAGIWGIKYLYMTGQLYARAGDDEDDEDEDDEAYDDEEA